MLRICLQKHLAISTFAKELEHWTQNQKRMTWKFCAMLTRGSFDLSESLKNTGKLFYEDVLVLHKVHICLQKTPSY